METVENFKPKYKPVQILLQVYFHLASVYGLHVLFRAKYGTIALAVVLYNVGMLGFAAGKHRLWSHRAFKAKLPLRILLAYMTSVDYVYSIITWVRDHRTHHKFCDTDADPYNATRGFFFAHLGTWMVTKHPDVKRKGSSIDVTDLYADPIVRFQHEYFALCGGVSCFIIPSLIPLLWDETFAYAWHINVLRFTISMHAILSINSVAHRFGFKSYEKNTSATNSVDINAFTAGEGFHNYHHAFPMDYRSTELPSFGLVTKFIDFFARIGWAYDLKTVSEEMIRERMIRTGDGTDMWGNALQLDKGF